jgi:uncharacterized protein YaeQ
VALTATIYNFEVELADSDRSVYESLALRVAQHPSESGEYLIARVLAYLLEYQEGIEFSRGVSEPDEPAIAVRDLTGKLTTWIEIGTPDSARLHKASKASPRVAVYCHKEGAQWLKGLAAAGIPRAENIELYAFDRSFIAEMVNRLERRVAFSMSVSDREIYLSIGNDNLTAKVDRMRI